MCQHNPGGNASKSQIDWKCEASVHVWILQSLLPQIKHFPLHNPSYGNTSLNSQNILFWWALMCVPKNALHHRLNLCKESAETGLISQTFLCFSVCVSVFGCAAHAWKCTFDSNKVIFSRGSSCEGPKRSPIIMEFRKQNLKPNSLKQN